MNDERGVTLIETIAALGIVILLSSAVAGFSHGILSAYDAHRQARTAHELAMSLMDEITPLRFEDPDGTGTLGPEALEWNVTEVRTQFDDVDDYAVWTGPRVLQSKTGTPLPYPGWSREVEVTYVLPTEVTSEAGGASDAKRIRVHVLAGGDTLSTVETVRVRGGRHVDVRS
jgi:type II secretory pathway pseudopilin PulG